MKGMIFAAGIGSRLKPWTDIHPKALVEINGRPAISYVIDKFISVGISTIIINVHHFAEQIIEYVNAVYSGSDIYFSDESDMLLDTGGGLCKALPLIGDDDVFIHNADILSDLPLEDLITAYRTSEADAMLLTQERDTQRYFLFNNGQLCGWTNIQTGQLRPSDLVLTPELDKRAFGGIHIVSHKAYPLLRAYAQADTPFSITNFYIDRCRELQIKSFDMPKGFSWFDVGKPETLQQARNFFKK